MQEIMVDKNLADEAAKVLDKFGYSVNDAVNRFLKEVVNKKSVLFEEDSVNGLYKGNDSVMKAFRGTAREFEGCADKWGLKSEDDIVSYIKEIRREN